MVIHNYIFDSYRIEQEKIKEAIQLLKENGYTIYKKEEKEII
jgi:biotin operon repressor